MINILCCERFERDIEKLINEKNHSYVNLQTFTCYCSSHKHIERSYRNVDLLVCNQTCKIREHADLEVVKTVLSQYCNESAAPVSILEYIYAHGGYITSSDSLLKWKENLDIEGFNQDTAQMFFSETIKELVYFNNCTIEDYVRHLKDFSNYVGLPYRVLEFKNVMFEERLNEAIEHILCENTNKTTINDLSKKYSESKMILKFTENIFETKTLDDVMLQLKSFFLMLFGASDTKYIEQNMFTSDLKEIETKIDTNRAKGLIKDGKIYMSLGKDVQLIGLLEIGGFLLSEHIDRYKKIADSLSQIISAAMLMHKRTDYERVKSMNLNLERTNTLLEGSMKVKEDYFSKMSHEMRTPLNSISGTLQLLDNSRLNRKQKDYLHTGMKSCDILLEVINNILDISKIKSSMIELEHSEIQLLDILEDVETIILPLMRHDQNNFVIDIPDEMPMIYGDSLRVRQIIINLLSNANKFTYRGEVSLKVDYILQGEGIKVSIEVEDTGIGMSSDQLDEIFNEYSQAHDPRLGIESTGLGLPIVKNLVELMDGKIEVVSEVGVGSTFRIDLKFNLVKNYVIDKKTKEVNILIAEDDPLNRLLIQKICENQNWTSKTVLNGKEAIDYLENDVVDLILLDAEMPVLNGRETIKILKQDNELADIPIVMLSGHSSEADINAYKSLAIDDYLVKPYNVNDLISLIKKYIK